MKTFIAQTDGPVIKEDMSLFQENDAAFKQSLIDMQNEMGEYIEEAIAQW